LNKLKNFLLLILAFSSSACLLTVIQVPFSMGFLAWIALVPFILACSSNVKTWRRVGWISYLVGSCYWLANLYWIGYVTVPAYILFCLYLGLYWPLLVALVRYCNSKNLPLFLTIPLLFCGAEAWQGILVTGFSWRLLCHSQHSNLPLIQIADIFGQMGISVIVAMVNGLIASLIIDGAKKRIFRPVNFAKVVFVILILATVVIYGNHRINQTDECTEPGPLIGIVQSNVPSAIKELSTAGEEILEDIIYQSEQCIASGSQLTVWPETMVVTTLNKGYLDLCRADTRPVRFHNMISAHCSRANSFVLLGSHAADFELAETGYKMKDKYNSALLYRPDGSQDMDRYDKIHLIPFGEYIPFKNSASFIYEMIIKLSPYDYDYNLTRGSRYTTFQMDTGEQNRRFGVLICYEDTDAKVARKMVMDGSGNKKADFLVNISNDGWYVRYKGQKVLPSVELAQRAVITAFRAVENRVSIARSVNTGISCLIDSAGRLQDGFITGTLPETVMERQGVAGWFVDRVRLDKRISFFSRHGQWLKFFCAVAMIVVIILALADKIIKKGPVK
jgi:apolipoprotein N-acyltransferase